MEKSQKLRYKLREIEHKPTGTNTSQLFRTINTHLPEIQRTINQYLEQKIKKPEKKIILSSLINVYIINIIRVLIQNLLIKRKRNSHQSIIIKNKSINNYVLI